MSPLPDDQLRALLQRCGGRAWADAVLAQAPFADLAALQRAAEAAWLGLDDDAWLAALEANAETDLPAGAEETRRAAEVALRLYHERFGIPFVAAARSRSADELLMRVRIRLGNDEAVEVRAARDELRRMARQRVERSWVEAA